MKEIELFKNTFYHIDGILYWKQTIGTRAIKNKRAGKQRKDGYLDVGIKGKYYLCHRIIFSLEFGYLPAIVDHINRIRSDNRPVNLRPATTNQNVYNSSISRSNRVRVKGIRVTRNGKFEARVAKNGITYQVGTFDTLDKAKRSLENLRKTLHGDFYCHE